MIKQNDYIKLVSIIVPVYNAEEYLVKCIDSILNQTYKKFELVLVNDGSEDLSSEICRKYAENDSRIVFIEQQNAGPSAARNTGILKSKGEYIQFLDADDYLTTDALKILVQAMEYSDYVIAAYFNLQQGIRGESENIVTSKLGGLYNKIDLLKHWGVLVEEQMFHYTWNKLYKSEYIRNKISFKEDIKISEDMIFNIDYLSAIETINIIREPVYYHILYNQQSITKRYHIGLFEMRRTTHNYVEDFLRTNDVFCDNNYSVVKNLYAKRIVSIFIHLVSKDTKISIREKKQIISYVTNDKSVRSVLHYFDNKLLSKITSYLIKKRRGGLIYQIYLIRDKVRIIVQYLRRALN